MDNRLPRLTTVVVLLIAALLGLPHIGGDDSIPTPDIAGKAMTTSEQSVANSHGSAQIPVGNRLIVQAAVQLERRRSVTARLNHQFFRNGQKVSGRGGYWQQGSGEDLRVRLELHISDQDASLLQVSNSPFLWLDRRLPTGRTVTRVDLRQLRADPILAAASFDDIHPGEASWASAHSELTAQCGGLPRLLSGLGESFSFMPPQAMRLKPSADSPPLSIPFFAVVGHWKQEKLAALLENCGTEAVTVPDRLPQEVLVLFGQTDLFPYRIEYRGLETPQLPTPNATPAPYQLSSNPMVVLELSDVAFDVPIAAGQFDYNSREVDWVDQTAAVLERLRRARQANVAARASAGSLTMPTR
jgi:hypothetical protein